jgi:polysaccharide biosynthesis/export protein
MPMRCAKVQVGLLVFTLSVMTGCAHDRPMTYPGTYANHGGYAHSSAKDGDWSAATTVAAGDGYYVVEPTANVHMVSNDASWGEPEVVPAVLGGAPQAVADTDGPYLLDTGDRLRVFVYGQPNLSRGYTVDHAGQITVPLIGRVMARGLTTQRLERRIVHKLGAEFVRDPQVTVDIQQNRPFFILGEVRNAGSYPYVSGMTVETAVAIAGGYSERASDRSFRITRRINGYVETIEAPADYVVRPGDTVFVHERFL